MNRHLPNLGALLDYLLGLLDEGASQVYADLDLDFRPRFTPVLRHLAEHGPSSIGELATATCLTHSASSQTVAAMRVSGLVSVRTGKTDGRERRVRLTAKAERMHATLVRAWSAMDAASAQLVDEAAPGLPEALSAAVAALGRHSFAERVRRATPPAPRTRKRRTRSSPEGT